MRVRVLKRNFLLILCIGAGSSVRAGDPEVSAYFLDPATGGIDGKIALAVYPVTYVNSRPDEYLNPAGFAAHLTPVDEPEVELVYALGSWFQPPSPKRYRIWVEGNGLMSPYSLMVIHGGAPFQGRGLQAALPVVAAGRVVLPGNVETGANLELRLLRAADHLEGELARWELSRRKASDQIGEGLLMPGGPAIGGLWDRRQEAYVALSRPFHVEPGKIVEVPLERPVDVADLVVQILRRTTAWTVENYNVAITLARQGHEVAPDLKVPTATAVYAFWFDIEPGPAEVRAESPTDILEPQQLELLPGKIERVAALLRERPALDVEIELPTAMDEETLTLEVRSLPDEEIIATTSLGHGVRSFRFDSLAPGLFKVVLKTSLGSYSRRVDLADGEDGFLLLEPELIVIFGTVYRGADGHRARLDFNTVRYATSEAKTDDQGAYEIVLLEPLRSVFIHLEGTDEAPFFEFFPTAIANSQELDFRVPAGRFDVSVMDAVTGQGIPGAEVLLRNTFASPDGESEPTRDQRDSERAVAQDAQTDDSGVAHLPPLRQGLLEIRASAAGYSPVTEPVSAIVLDQDLDQTFQILLHPLGPQVPLRLTLPGGTAAANAEILVVTSLDGAGRAVYSGQAGADGLVNPPREPANAILLAKHPNAGFLVREWNPPAGDEEVRWQLPAASHSPLFIFLKDPSGEEAAPRAELAVWVNGYRLSGGTLAWLTGSRPTADVNGYWRGSNFPQSPVAVLAWPLGMREQAYAGILDGLAVGIEFPWPDRIELSVAR